MNKFAPLMSIFNQICKLPTHSKAFIMHNLGKVLLQVRLHEVNFIPQALVSLCTGMHFSSLYGLAVSHCNMNAEAVG